MTFKKMISFQIKNKGIHEVLKFENMAQMYYLKKKKENKKRAFCSKLVFHFIGKNHSRARRIGS